MGKIIAKIILKIWGWKIYGAIPEGVKKCVIIAAPHTSNLDFLVGRLAYSAIGVRARFLIKKEAFKGWRGPLARSLGGISIDRGKRNNMVDQVADLFNQYESLYVVITPEGTRKLVRQWKKGFYFIAQKADVPIAMVYMDYAKKEGGVGPSIHPSGDYTKDMKVIEDFYRDKTARHPEKFNLTPKEVLEKPEVKEKSVGDLKRQYCNRT